MLISSLRGSAEHDHGTYILLRSWPKTITSAFQLLSSIKHWTSSNIYRGCIRTPTSSPFLSFPLQLSVCSCADTKLLASSLYKETGITSGHTHTPRGKQRMSVCVSQSYPERISVSMISVSHLSRCYQHWVTLLRFGVICNRSTVLCPLRCLIHTRDTQHTDWA